MRKPVFRICKKGADLYRAAGLRLCFRYIESTINLKFQASSHLLWLYSPVCDRPSQNPEDRFYLDAAHKQQLNQVGYFAVINR